MTTITELTDEQIGDIYKTEFAVEDPGSSFVIRFARAIITASRAKSAALSTPATAPEQCWCDEHGIGEPGVSCGDCPTRDYKSPATAPEQPDAEVTVQHFRGLKSMENIDWTLYSDFPPGTHKLYRHPPATAPSWQNAPTEPGMWACLYMGELSTAIFNAYEIEHFDRDEMVGCRWRFIPEDKQ